MQRNSGQRLPSVAVLMCSALVVLGGCAPQSASTLPNQAAASLGARLYSDTRLSADGKVSCASCHDPQHAFSDGKPVSVGVHGRQGTRNAPSLLNIEQANTFFWDGRERSLESVVLQPITNPTELGLGSMRDAIDRLRAIPAYRIEFSNAFGRHGAISERDIAAALSAHLRSLPAGSSRYDRFVSDNSTAPPHKQLPNRLTADELQGLRLFDGKAGCSGCHALRGQPPAFTDARFHHAGVGFERIAGEVAPLLTRLESLDRMHIPAGRLVLTDPQVAALGRFVVTRKPADLGAFRTPSLRNVALTAPYMHDGSTATLEQAIERELYYRGLAQGRPIELTAAEQKQLATFLRALSTNQAGKN